MSNTRQIGINVITLWISFVLRAAIGVLLVPFLIKELGRDVYGLAILLGVVVSFAEIADMGLRMALGRNLAEAIAVKDKDAYNRLASTAAAIWLSLGSIMAITCVALAPEIVTFLDIPSEIEGDAIFLVRAFGGGSILLAFILPLFTAVLSSNNRFDIVNKLDAAFGLTTGILIFIVISLTDYGIYAWASVMFGGKILIIGIKAIAARKLVPSLRISPQLIDGHSFRKLFSLSGYLFFLNLTNLLSMKADPIILSRFLGTATLALYNPGLMLSSRVRPLVQVLATQLYPLTTKFHTTGDDDRMKLTLFVGTRITLCMGIGAFAVLAVFSQDICRIWLEKSLGPDYRVAGYILLGWAFVDLFQAAAGSQWPIMIGKNRVRFLVFTQFPLALLNIASSVYLVVYTDLGVVGVIIPTVLIGGFRRILTTLYVNYLLQLNLLEYLREAYLRPFMVFIILIPTAILIAYYLPTGNIIELIVKIGLASIVWALLLVTIGVTKVERNFLFHQILNYLKSIKKQYFKL
jgi:O-antigen/teichoic acid export membrane protein